MNNPLSIVEILGRSEQGRTHPFLCRCDNDQLYYVKGQYAGQRSLICEWLSAHLARAMGLPIPEFTTVQAPQSLLDLHPEGHDLGTAPAFGSRKVDHVHELTVSYLDHVDAALQRDILVFDWWVRNGDRTLTAISGNPNLLWDAADRRLVVIDHNLAFDRKYDTAEFSETHVFRKQISHVFQDLAERGSYSYKLRNVLAVWPEACNNVPTEWWFVDAERTVPTDFDPTAVLTLLNHCTTEEFWRIAP